VIDDISTIVDVSLGNDVEIACGDTEIEICPIVTPSGANYSFAWIFPDNSQSTDSCITATLEGDYIVVVTDLANGCSDSDTINVTTEVCPTAKHCTLTQGGWGNANGKFCDGPRRLALLNSLLTSDDL